MVLWHDDNIKQMVFQVKNYLSTLKKAENFMNFKMVLFILIYTVYTHEIFPVTIQIDKIETSDHTKITFFSDQHKKSSGEEEQITSLIDFLQEQSDNHSFHFLVEQASELNKSFASGYETLYTLDKHIEQVRPLMTHVRLDNIEIRHAAGPAMDILNYYEDYKNHSEYKTDDAKKMIGSITFQDVLDEFDNLKQSLASYYLNQTNQAISDIYASYIETADSNCEQFKRKILSGNGVVFEYAKVEYNKRILRMLQASNLPEEEDPAKILADSIECSFIHLFDLNLLKTILTSDSQNILVFAGGEHAREVINMLSALKAATIFQARNSVLEEKIEEDGHKTLHETVLPITGLQITQALSAQPKESSSSYVRVMCYMAMAAACYYLVFVIIPGQIVYG